MSDLPFETTVPVRYTDLDPLGHVNNAAYATYLEEARIQYFSEALGIPEDEISTVVAHLELDFEAPIVDTQYVTVRVGPTDVGEKSFTLTYEIDDETAVVARGETVQVWIDTDGSPSVLPDALEAALSTQRSQVPD